MEMTNGTRRGMITGAAISVLLLTVPISAHALETTELVMGTKNLLNDATRIATGIVGAVFTFLFVKEIIKWATADEHEKGPARSKVKSTAIIGVIATCATGLISALFSYYGG